MTFKYTIDNKYFETQTKLREHIKSILHKYSPGASLSQDDYKFVEELLSHHPQTKKKIGCGLKDIQINKNEGGTVSFYIIRKDNSSDDFSYPKCIRNYKPR